MYVCKKNFAMVFVMIASSKKGWTSPSTQLYLSSPGVTRRYAQSEGARLWSSYSPGVHVCILICDMRSQMFLHSLFVVHVLFMWILCVRVFLILFIDCVYFCVWLVVKCFVALVWS